MHKLLILLLIPIFVFAIIVVSRVNPKQAPILTQIPSTQNSPLKETPHKIQTPKPIPTQKLLTSDYHVFQTFNNCGPAALSMTLFYFGINVSQKELGLALRPYQNPQGDNDDKSVTLAELAQKAEEYYLLAYHRPAGSIDKLKRLLATGIPVITRTWLNPNEDIGHFRVIKGYNDSTQTITQDDSLQGKNLSYTYSDFNVLWEKFNFEYLVLARPEQKLEVEAILADDVNEQAAWQKAAKNALTLLQGNPDDIYTRFNYSVALYHLGNYQESIAEYEKVASKLPFRTLWYQIEPIEAYFKAKRYSDVLQITERILNNHNRAYSELYKIRGDIYTIQGTPDLAQSEYQKAVFYNANFSKIVPNSI